VDTVAVDPLVGRLVDGRYRLDRHLARGGMATVYAATDTRLERSVAVKLMRGALADDPEFVQRFAREALAAARLTSRHTVAVYDQGTDASGTAYLVMELVDGHTLRDVLESEGALPPARAMALLDPVLRALAAAHEAGVVHRDIKPENVLLSTDGRVKVADFGLARAVEASNATATTGLLIGTVAYLAPEQVEQGRADPRTDVYAAGILLWELLTGAPPYGGPSPLAIAYRHVNEDVAPPSAVVTGVPTALDALVVRATRRDPGLRPADGAAFLAELQEARADLTGAAPTGKGRQPTLVVPRPGPTSRRTVPDGDASRPRRRGAARLAVLLVALLLLIGGTLGGAAALTTTTPDVVGAPQEQAAQRLSAAGLSVELLPPRYDTTVPEQRVVVQQPAPGERLRRGGTVGLSTSLGPPTRTVPTLIGLPQQRASAAVVQEGLTLGPVRQRYDSAPEGEVLAAEPAQGSTLKPGSAVSLVVSKGVELLPVPDVAGQQQAAAGKAVRDAGLSPETSTAFSDDVPAGDVVSQTPASGQAARGSLVALVVSKGPDLVAVPTVTGDSRKKAAATIRAAGLVPTFTVVLGFGPEQVLRTDPGRGKKVTRGSTVTVYLF